MSIANVDRSQNPVRFSQGKGGSFYQALCQRSDEYFSVSHRMRFATPAIWAKAAFYFAVALAAYALILSGEFGPSAMLLLAIVFGVATLLLAINAGHDGAHSALSRSQWINDAVLYFSFALIGVDPYLWRFRHVRSHHVFPNVNGCDIDIDSNWLIRLSPNHPRLWYQRYQHLYAPFVYAVVSLHVTFVEDFLYLFKKRLANMTDIRHPKSAYISFVLCKAVYFLVVVAVPLLVLPIPAWQVLTGIAVMSFVSSSLFVYLLIGTHFVGEALFPEAGKNGEVPGDWATHNVLTALDWHPKSRIATFIGGGANSHAAHHLFPNVSHAHYLALTRILERTAAEFGVPYRATTLPRMIASHFRFLKRVGVAEPYAKQAA